MRFCRAAKLAGLLMSVRRAASQSSSTSASGGSSCHPSTSLTLLSSTDCSSACSTTDLCIFASQDTNTSTSGLSETCNDESGELKCLEEEDDSCHVVCMNAPLGEFTLLVPFGSNESEEERDLRLQYGDEAVDKALASLGNDTGSFPSVNNDVLQSIGSISLDSTVQKVHIAGGNSYELSLRGVVASIEFGESFIESQTQVLDVTLMNLDLSNVTDRLTSLLPSSVMRLSLDNTLQQEFPRDLNSALPSLAALSLTSNTISEVDSSVTMEYLIYLYLHGNDLTRFEGAMPVLEYLYLNYNNLTSLPVMNKLPKLLTLNANRNYIQKIDSSSSSSSVTSLTLTNNNISTFTAEYPSLEELFLDNNSLSFIPESLYKSTALKTLTLTGNKLSLVLTRSQLSFLQNLTTLNISVTDPAYDVSSSSCVSMEVLKSVTVCVISDATTTQDEANDHGVSIGVITIIVFSIILLLVGSTIVYVRKCRSGQLRTRGSQTLVTLWSDQLLLSLRLAASDIEDVRQLGSGAFGVVWLVNYQGNRLLASKRLKADTVTRQHTQDFVNEIKLLARLHHPNIVSLVGVAWTHEVDLQALTEFVDGGDLRDFLIRNSDFTWSVSKFQIAIGIADALSYVHSFQPPIVHRDLKSRNVLLTSALDPKVTDFGASREQSYNKTMTQGVGTARWQAPEVLSGSSDYDYTADVFSFGVILAELDSHKLPYEGVRGAGGELLADIAILHLVAMGELRPSLSSSCPQNVRKLAERCMDQNPRRRPSAAEVAFILRSEPKGNAV